MSQLSNWDYWDDYDVSGYLTLNFDEFKARFPKAHEVVHRALKSHSSCRFLEATLIKTGEMKVYILPGTTTSTPIRGAITISQKRVPTSEWDNNHDLNVMDVPGVRVLPLGRDEITDLRSFFFSGPYELAWPTDPRTSSLADVFNQSILGSESTLEEWKTRIRIISPTSVNFETVHKATIRSLKKFFKDYEARGNVTSAFTRFMARKSLTSRATVLGIHDTFISYYYNAAYQLLILLEKSNAHLSTQNTMSSHLQYLYSAITTGFTNLEFHNRTRRLLATECKLIDHIFNMDSKYPCTPWISFPHTLFLPNADTEGLSQETFCNAAAMIFKVIDIVNTVVLDSM